MSLLPRVANPNISCLLLFDTTGKKINGLVSVGRKKNISQFNILSFLEAETCRYSLQVRTCHEEETKINNYNKVTKKG
jgi:hypothetical protein